MLSVIRLNFRIIVFQAVFAGLFLSAAVYAKENEGIILVGNEPVPAKPNLIQGAGPILRILQEAFKRSGYDTEYRVTAWSRALKETEHGTFDALISTYWSAEREKVFLYSDPYAVHQISLLKKKSFNFNWSTASDLTPYRIGLVRNGLLSEELQAASDSLQILRLQNVEAVIRMVVFGRVEMGISQQHRAMKILQAQYPEKVELMNFVEKPLAIENAFIVVSRKHPEGPVIIDAFNKGLRQMIADGSYRKVMIDGGFKSVMIPLHQSQ